MWIVSKYPNVILLTNDDLHCRVFISNRLHAINLGHDVTGLTSLVNVQEQRDKIIVFLSVLHFCELFLLTYGYCCSMKRGVGPERRVYPTHHPVSWLGFNFSILLLLLPLIIILKLLRIKPQFVEALVRSSSVSRNHDCAAAANEAHWNRGNKRELEGAVHLLFSPGRTTIFSQRTCICNKSFLSNWYKTGYLNSCWTKLSNFVAQ